MKSIITAGLGLVLSFAICDAGENWPQWRGPQGNGHTSQKLPLNWSENDVAWKVHLPGVGQSSPIVWGDRIFLTSAADGGSQRILFCIDGRQGKIVWQQTVWTGSPEKTHVMNNRASATCATDGERVVAFFGKGGLHCYSLEGDLLWSRELGEFAGPWGTAASPIIVGDLVIQNCDADDEAYLIAVDKQTGKTVWKTPRLATRGWSTPILVDSDKRQELVLNGHEGMHGYDPQTGKELWFCKMDRGRGTPTVAQYKDLLIAVSGRPGDMVATKGGGSGLVNSSHEVWRTSRRGGRDLPSPIVVGDDLVVFSLRPGMAACYDAATGKERHRIRLEGNFSASPIVSQGLIYIPNEAGEIFVIRAGSQLEVVARNPSLASGEEIFRASLTPYEGRILCRSDRVLYCIGK